MNKELPRVKLSDICRPTQWPTIPQSQMTDEGYPVFGANGRIGYYTEYNHEHPTVLITCRGATCGTINVCDPKSYVTGNAMALDGLDPQTADRRFLAYALNWRGLRDAITGSAQPQITRTSLSGVEIPLPSLSEQKRIADILDKADAIRRKRQEALKFRNPFLKSAFLQMFGDPATNPKKLPLRELSEFYVSPKDGTKCGPFGGALKKDEYTSAGVPVWNMDNISDDGRLVPNTKLWISQEKYEDLSSYSVRDGDVIISRAGTVGKMCVVRAGLKESIISTNLIRLRLNSSLIPEFFVSLMVFFKGRAGRLKTGPDGAFTHMSTGVLDKLTIPYPAVSDQRDYVSIMERMDRSTLRLTTAVKEADGLFNSLVQRAFNGDL